MRPRRREARRPKVRLPEPAGRLEVSLPRGAEPVPTPPQALESSERARRVQEALQKLSPKLRAVAVLRYVEGLSYHELAEVLQCEMGTVKSRLNRAHTALKHELGPAFPALADPKTEVE